MLFTMLPNSKFTIHTLVAPLQCVGLHARDMLEVVGPFGFLPNPNSSYKYVQSSFRICFR
jgi:hypothetical protein